MSDSCKVAIVAALEREVWPLVKDWPVCSREHDGRQFKFFENNNVALVCGGIGSEAARRAAEAVLTLYQPVLIISAGFAGGVDPGLQAGHTLVPRHVIDAGDGSRVEVAIGEGVLVSLETVAGAEQKAKFGDAFGAHAVDMEAAAVARSAEAHGVKFLACKVISDATNSRLPPVTRFIGEDGRFHASRFIVFVALRPWLWASVVRLARDTAKAAAKLSVVLGSADWLELANSEKPVLTR